VFFGHEREKLSEEKPVERPSEEKPVERLSEEKPVEKQSGEKPSEQPQPKPKPKLVRFHCDYCGRDGHKGEFCFKRKHEERMAKD
jgi:outer membrane biosynthesis protein TonB